MCWIFWVLLRLCSHCAASLLCQQSDNIDSTKYIVVCQGGGVSSKTRRHGADKTLTLKTLHT